MKFLVRIPYSLSMPLGMAASCFSSSRRSSLVFLIPVIEATVPDDGSERSDRMTARHGFSALGKHDPAAQTLRPRQTGTANYRAAFPITRLSRAQGRRQLERR